jgi:DNA polymerase-3 subunit delta'
MQWENIIGHEDNKVVIRRLISEKRVPHAWLFCGSRGVGKFMTAQVMAAALLCQREEGPCGECLSCRQIRAGNHPDFILVKPEGSTIKIEQIRNLQHEMARATYRGDYRVCIIDDAEQMTLQAANSLLKMLEEPTGNSIFIMISSRRHQLLATIISRCRVMIFRQLSDSILAAELIRHGVEPLRAQTAARLGGGCLGGAMILANPDGLLLRDEAVHIIAGLNGDAEELVWDTAAAWEKRERSDVQELLRFMACVFRDLVVLRYSEQQGLLLNCDLAEPLEKYARRWTEAALIQCVKTIDKARGALRANANLRLTGEALLINLCRFAGKIDL